MTGARPEAAIALEQEDNTWTCECGHENTMSSYELNQGGPAPCKNLKCKIITVL